MDMLASARLQIYGQEKVEVLSPKRREFTADALKLRVVRGPDPHRKLEAGEWEYALATKADVAENERVRRGAVSSLGV